MQTSSFYLSSNLSPWLRTLGSLLCHWQMGSDVSLVSISFVKEEYLSQMRGQLCSATRTEGSVLQHPHHCHNPTGEAWAVSSIPSSVSLFNFRAHRAPGMRRAVFMQVVIWHFSTSLGTVPFEGV